MCVLYVLEACCKFIFYKRILWYDLWLFYAGLKILRLTLLHYPFIICHKPNNDIRTKFKNVILQKTNMVDWICVCIDVTLVKLDLIL